MNIVFIVDKLGNNLYVSDAKFVSEKHKCF